MKACWVLALVPVFLSGLFGYLAGNVSAHIGLPQSYASTIAGFSGFMGAQMFQFVGIVISQRYRQRFRSPS